MKTTDFLCKALSATERDRQFIERVMIDCGDEVIISPRAKGRVSNHLIFKTVDSTHYTLSDDAVGIVERFCKRNNINLLNYSK